MKILLFIDNPGQDSLYTFWGKALQELGQDVLLFDQMETFFKQSCLFKKDLLRHICHWSLREKHLWGRYQTWPIYLCAPFIVQAQKKMNSELIKKAREFNPQLIVILKGLGVYPKTLQTIKSLTNSKIINFNGDDPYNFYSSNKNIIDCLPIYDYVFTWSKRLMPQLLNNGAKHVHYLPFAADPDIYKSGENLTANERKIYGSDIAFVGTGDSERKKELEPLTDLDIGIWGPYWDRYSKKSPLRKRIKGGRVDVPTTAKIYRSSKVVLNLMREQNFSSHNMKTFEIPSIGAFMLAPRTSEHAEFFVEGEDIACYGATAELREKAIYYINHDEERMALAKSAHQKTIQHHTYIQRMKELLAICGFE